jgi:hypothetical protein
MAPVDNARVEKLYNEMKQDDQLRKRGAMEFSPVRFTVELVNQNAKRADEIMYTAEKIAKENGDDLKLSGGTKRRYMFNQTLGMPAEDVDKALDYLENWRKGQGKDQSAAPSAKAPEESSKASPQEPAQEEVNSKWRDTVAAQKATTKAATMGGPG